HRGRQSSHRYLAALRGFLRPFGFDFGESAIPAIRKSSIFFPDLIAAVSQRGFNPRPAQVSAGFSGLRYLVATALPATRPRSGLEPLPPPLKWVRLASLVWSDRRCSVTLAERAASTRPLSSTSFSIDIVFKAIFVPPLQRGHVEFRPRKAMHVYCFVT